MALSIGSISVSVEEDLSRVINAEITANDTFNTSSNIFLTAVETIKSIRDSWAAVLQHDDEEVDNFYIVDKLHLVYTAAEKLHRHRDHPCTLPAQIITCFTRQIQHKRTVTAGVVREILQGATRAEITHMKKVEGNITAGTSTFETETASVAMTGKEGTDGSTAMRPGNEPLQARTAASAGAGNPDALNITSCPPKISTTTDTPASTTKNKGPGNFGKEQGIKWYPDEDEFMQKLILANPTWTYKKYEDANRTRFEGTFYVDEEGFQHPGMRERRTANALRLRFGKFRREMKAGGQTKQGGTEGDFPKGDDGGVGASTDVRNDEDEDVDMMEASRSEIGDDENPLQDLEDLVAQVEADKQ